MASTKNKVAINGVQLTTAIVTYFDDTASVNNRIVAFTVSNDLLVAASYDLHIVPSGGSANASNRIIKGEVLLGGESDTPGEPINQLIPIGGSIQMKASANSAIAVRCSVIEFA